MRAAILIFFGAVTILNRMKSGPPSLDTSQTGDDYRDATFTASSSFSWLEWVSQTSRFDLPEILTQAIKARRAGVGKLKRYHTDYLSILASRQYNQIEDEGGGAGSKLISKS